MLGNSYGSHNLTIRKHACRLRYILHQLNSGQLSMDNLKKNLEYMTLLLETEYMDETRRICDEENDLADVKPEVVSDEVRKWLAATFTKQSVDLKREKPKLKSVANAILTGIFFDKMFRKSQVLLVSLPPDIVALMKNLNSWSFDCFRLNEVSEGHALKYVGLELFSRYRFLDRYKIPVQTLENYIAALEVGYSKHNNPYHNIIHAADVTASSHFMLSQTGFATSLSDLDTLAVIFGAMIHDYQHTGHTNNFHIQAGSHYALLYNDRNVLENHHISASFRLLKEDDKNIMKRLTREEFRELRNLLIEIVLATDMSSHFAQIKTMKAMLSSPEGIDKTKAICLIVHACDISHASKPWELHSRWTEGVLEEFFRQGDLEASMGLPYSPLCDRNTVHVADSQIGFIDFIVEPTMIICGEMLTRIIEPLVPLRSSNTFLLSENSDSLLPSVDITQESETGNTSYNERNSSFRFLPLNQAGKLEIPTPWMEFMQENKDRWKKRAAKEEDERKKSQAIAAK
ncbi:PDE1B protein [Loa loa]|uniref:Phosphodiesterase n=1 Tax=Loa loa TaxID=7209 RepID=A0A1S0TU85_LOALO|nr:PDE1B protein [Loa loa]EFO20298.1 PDE1B protein [Loa loa]